MLLKTINKKKAANVEKSIWQETSSRSDLN